MLYFVKWMFDIGKIAIFSDGVQVMVVILCNTASHWSVHTGSRLINLYSFMSLPNPECGVYSLTPHSVGC